jgi:DNA-binding MarR family transcriptional regulator
LLAHPGHDGGADLDGVDELSAQVFSAFIRVLQMHRRYMSKALAEQGTHAGQAFCLRFVGERDGITQRDLAAELHLAPPTVTKMLQAMQKAGVVERRQDEHDQRLTRVYLTTAGRRLLDEVRVVASNYVNQTIAPLPEEDRRELLRLLGALSDGMRQAAAGESGAHA